MILLQARIWGSLLLGIVALFLILPPSGIPSPASRSSSKPVALLSTPNAVWLEAVRQNIERDEYRPKPQLGDGPSWGLSNRANGLSSHVSHRGWEIKPVQAPRKRDASPDWNWRYQFTGVRRGTESMAVSVNSIDANDERVTISRVGQIREWYSNSRLGIEQGFDLLVKPEGNSSDTVILEGAVETSLQAERPERDALTFSHNGIPVLSYSGLKTIDATGAVVPSWLSLETTTNGGIVRIHIDDSSAHYPIHVDPLASSPQWSVIGEQEMSSLSTVTGVGDINNDGYDDVAVGDPNFHGANSALGKAYVYYGSAVGLPTTPGWSMASDLPSQFGAEVAGAGDVNQDGFDDVLIGAPAESVEGIGYPGKAYLFLGSATGLSESPAWSTHGASTNGYYGLRLSGGGDVNGDGFSDVLVGEPWAESSRDRGARSI